MTPYQHAIANLKGIRTGAFDMDAAADRMDESVAAIEATIADLVKALAAMLKEHDILSGNYDGEPIRPDRWPYTAAVARAALEKVRQQS